MEKLTENQQKVLTAIQNGADTNDTIAGQSGIARGSITAVVNSLIKRELVSKTEDGKYVGAIETSENDSQQLSSSDESPVTDPGRRETRDESRITVLVPYLKSEAAGEELKYALRSWQQNFKEEFNVVVIGDKEDWFSPEVQHIPHEPHLIKEVCDCPSPSMIRNPQADATHKLFTAIAALGLTGDVVRTSDDVFILGSTTLGDLKVLKVFHKNLKPNTAGSLYDRNTLLAGKRLEKENLPVLRYGTHTPNVFDTGKLVEIIEKYDALEHGYPIESIYFNDIHPDARPMIVIDGGINDPVLASVYRPNVDDKLMAEIIATRKFLNCNTNGWLSVVKHLETAFPNPSRFEK